MKFQDYCSAFDCARKSIKQQMKENKLSKEQVENLLGFDIDNYVQYYSAELRATKAVNAVMAGSRFLAELMWYAKQRPYFNVYPLIERKFLEMNDSIELSELSMPLPSIEVRTTKRTMLLSDFGESFMLTVELGNNGDYQEFRVSKKQTLSLISTNDFVRFKEPRFGHCSIEKELSQDELSKVMFLAAGVCLLSKDSDIITPIILNSHRNKEMTPSEVAKYAEKAIKRTGRIGFDVGKDIERMKATIHYRNGCFAKYYVGKGHESYPVNATESKVPIIKWRCGSIVNKDSIPKVPTGYKD